MNSINSEPFHFSWNRLELTAEKWCAKIQSIQASEKFGGGVWYWDVQYEIHIDTESWNAFPLDRGTVAMGPKTRDEWSPSSVVDGKTPQRAATDVDGEFVQEPVLLNGHGLPLDNLDRATGEVDYSKGVYLEYLVYSARVWNDYPLMQNLPQHNNSIT
jgi:hypothetical protein